MLKKSFAFFCFLFISLAKNILMYRYIAITPEGVSIFVLGLLLGSPNPAKEEEREFLYSHGKAVSIFVQGLLLGSSNPAKEE